MDTIVLIGRIIFSLLFIGSGIGHLAQTADTAATAAAKGLPSPTLLARLSGVALLAGGLGVSLGIWPDLALLGIALLMVILNATMHRFWETEGERQQWEMSQFMKNLAIAGASIALFGFFAYGEDANMLVGPLFDLSE
ncbi:MAG: DoxX family protein [Actinomycetota bacterium]